MIFLQYSAAMIEITLIRLEFELNNLTVCRVIYHLLTSLSETTRMLLLGGVLVSVEVTIDLDD